MIDKKAYLTSGQRSFSSIDYYRTLHLINSLPVCTWVRVINKKVMIPNQPFSLVPVPFQTCVLEHIVSYPLVSLDIEKAKDIPPLYN